MLKAYPDYGKLSPDSATTLVAGLTEFLASIDPRMAFRLCSPVGGVPARCKFIPTIADFGELVREFEAKATAVRASHPIGYKYLAPGPEIDPRPPSERIAEQTEEWRQIRDSWKCNKKLPPHNAQSSEELRTPAAPPSPALLRLIAEQDAR